MGTAKRLERAFTQAPVLPLGRRSKYVLISDCHRGVGTSSDNFLKNQHLYFAALEHYYRLGYTYIELGDGDELWENRRLRNIIEVHSDVYDMLTRFHISGRLYMLYGNHDIVKKRLQHPSGSMSIRDGYHYRNKKTSFARLRDLPPANSDKRRNFLYHKKCPYNGQEQFPDASAYTSGERCCPQSKEYHTLCPIYYEAIILRQESIPERSLYLTHGHQASLLNSTFWPLARFLVRYIWSPLENLGILDPTSAAKNYEVKEKSEQALRSWADENRRILITGHTHRPVMPEDFSYYYNTGSCVHPRCITCIEIERGMLTLVKWSMQARLDSVLYVARDVIGGPIDPFTKQPPLW